jgi:hypothetical protein
MNQQTEAASPAPWDDPEFASRRSNRPWAKFEARRSRRRIGALGLIVAVIWLAVLLDSMVGPLLLDGLLALAMTLGVTLVVFLSAMALGMIGTGLFAVGDRVIAWVRQGSRWPEE